MTPSKKSCFGIFLDGMKPNPKTLSIRVWVLFHMPPYPQQLVLPTSYLPLPIHFPSHLSSYSFTLNIVLFPLFFLCLLCLPLHCYHLCSFSPFFYFSTNSKKLCCQQLRHCLYQEVTSLIVTLLLIAKSCVASHHSHQLCCQLHSHQQHDITSRHYHQQ